MNEFISIALNVWAFLKANWVAILAVLYSLDNILKLIGSITGNKTITSWALMLGTWLGKLPQTLAARRKKLEAKRRNK